MDGEDGLGIHATSINIDYSGYVGDSFLFLLLQLELNCPVPTIRDFLQQQILLVTLSFKQFHPFIYWLIQLVLIGYRVRLCGLLPSVPTDSSPSVRQGLWKQTVQS